jgi:hypothetical protein
LIVFVSNGMTCGAQNTYKNDGRGRTRVGTGIATGTDGVAATPGAAVAEGSTSDEVVGIGAPTLAITLVTC